MKSAALKTTFEDPGEFDIGDTVEAHGIDPRDSEFDDVTSDVYACCSSGKGGCLTITECGVTRCVYCKQIVAR